MLEAETKNLGVRVYFLEGLLSLISCFVEACYFIEVDDEWFGPLRILFVS
jgi:hypothetical protein